MRYFLELTEDEVVSVEKAGMAMVVARTDDFIYLQSPSIVEAYDGSNERRQDDGDVSPVQE